MSNNEQQTKPPRDTRRATPPKSQLPGGRRDASPRELPPTRETILARGELCAKLLGSPVFNVAVRTAIENCQDAILHSDPGAVLEREGYYAAMRGMNMILGELAVCIHLAQALTQRELDAEEGAAGAWNAHLSGN